MWGDFGWSGVIRMILAKGVVYCFLFFFQAEDGIRDVAVTGVQTCALPISAPAHRVSARCAGAAPGGAPPEAAASGWRSAVSVEIGRASCRERVEVSVVAGGVQEKDNGRQQTHRTKYDQPSARNTATTS